MHQSSLANGEGSTEQNENPHEYTKDMKKQNQCTAKNFTSIARIINPEVPSGLDLLFSAIYHKVELKNFKGKERESKNKMTIGYSGKENLVPR